MSYIKLNGREFDADVSIGEYTRTLNVLDGSNAGRVMTGRMVRDVIGAYIGYNIKVYPRGMDYKGIDEFWTFLKDHSVDDSVMLEAADSQTTLSYEAYYTSASQKLESVQNGINYWGEVTVNFIPMDATVTP